MRKFLIFALIPAFLALTACQKSTEETSSPEASASAAGSEASPAESASAAAPEASASSEASPMASPSGS
jgi:hypothetical protein